MAGIIISVIFLIVGAFMTLDGYNSMSAIWRSSNESLLMIGIVVLVLGFVILLVSLIKMLKSKK
ncbi:MAG: hypothetical protein ACI4W6_10865 [Acutalibacteraceae bacterium]